MRIALVVGGGVDRSGREHVIPTLLALIERLARRHDVIVYVLRYHADACTYPLLGATVRDLGRPTGALRQYKQLVAAMAHEGAFDVLHAYMAAPAGLVAAAAGRRLGVPCLVTADSGEFVSEPDINYGSQGSLRQRLGVAATIRLATAITVCTDYQADLARVHGVTPRVVPLGIDRRCFGPSTRLEGPPWRLLHVSRDNAVKDHVTLLRAFQAVVRLGVDVHLDLVGEGTSTGAIPELARSLSVDERVTFHGFQPTDRLVPLYQRSHLYVLSSRHEAAGAVVLEAAACGVPVVGTRVGYIADWAADRAEAVPVARPDLLAEAIRALLADRARREQLATAARQWTLSHDADWTAEEFERMYQEIR